MTLGASYGSPEWREAIAEGKRRGAADRRRRQRVRPAHVDAWLASELVEAALRPIVRRRAEDFAAMLEDLGGADHVTAMQRAALDTWLKAAVVTDAEFQRYVRGERDTLDRLSTYLNTARSALAAIGLERRVREVEQTLGAYVAAKAAKATTIDVSAAPDVDSAPAADAPSASRANETSEEEV